MAVYDGQRHLGPVSAGVRSCGLVACVSGDRRTCAGRSPKARPQVFTSVSLVGVYDSEDVDDVFTFPATLTTNLAPTKGYFYCERKGSDGKPRVEMSTAVEEKALLAFGFYSRVYSRDVVVVDLSKFEKLSGDEWMQIFMGSAAFSVVLSVVFIFYAQRTDMKLKFT